MRVAIVSQQGGTASGAEHALLEFVERLPQSVELRWFFFEDGAFARSIQEKFGQVTIVPMSSRLAAVKRQRLSMSPLTDAAVLTWRLARRLRAAQPDLVLTNSMKAHVIGSLAAKLCRLACINYVHDIIEGRALALLRVVSRFCSTERLACSAAVKRQLDLPRTSVAYAAINVESFAALPDRRVARRELGIPDDALPVVALVGRIARWKRQDLFIRVMARVARRVDAYFCIIGSPLFGVDAEYVGELERLVADEGLGARVRFIPWQADTRTVYAAIDVSCNCSVREPFGRTSLEALACGVPIVCFDDAGICEIFEQHRGGTQIGIDDEAAFADGIVQYLTDHARRAAAQIEAREAARRLDARFAYPIFFDAIARVSRQPARSLYIDREAGAA